MRLLLHIGLHKTASTFLQHLFNGNQPALAARGVWYRPQPDYPADRLVSWALLQGEPAPLVEMIEEARAAHCATLVLSCEDLEGALCHPAAARAVDRAVAQAGVDAVEWHAVLRDPAAAFASVVAQESNHEYGDTFQMFHAAMAKGGILFAQPDPGPYDVPYAFSCFDHDRYFTKLAGLTRHPVFCHDFADASPFPGWRLADRLGILDALVIQPGAEGRNARLSEAEVAARYVARMAEAVPDFGDRLAILQMLGPSLRASLEAVEPCALLVGKRFAESHRAALARFGLAAPADRAAPVGRAA